ncbi:cytochrome c [Pontibacter ummariensis]|uniref:Cytochrome c n=1 Tax=Pontibacter ummariensis TaxID=1610492 RepID=A0A239I721_9BACT|nr:cytochrome c [Pontibacter ummariensis]PRY10208.1 cytochrome c [Pontibacter ummariensis]SNS88124.1 Cytochrome c [Pontibacter ummariensis]
MLKGVLLAVFITSGYLFASQGDSKLQESIKRGEAVYTANCQACHQAEGTGIPGAFPPLAKSDFLKDQKKVIGVVVHGLSGEIKVNGETYNMQMPAQSHLTDQQVADVLNYVQNNWGNKATAAVTPAQVAAIRKK